MLVTMQDGSPYVVSSLLARPNANAKIAKSNKSGKGYLTTGLSLAPFNLSGFQVCPHASDGCAKSCLFTSGMGAIPNVKRGRIAKTRAYFQHRESFLIMLVEEIGRFRRNAIKKGLSPAIRLNVLSDIPWEKVFPELFILFPDVQFYDYTKNPSRLGNVPANYHLTFSRSESNDKWTDEALLNGHNVAVVFSRKQLPSTYKGYKVVNGDETDLRFLDEKNVVVGLYAKGKAKKDNSGFVIKAGV